MNWQKKPDSYGWWFYTERLEDWDLAKPVSVSRHEYGDRTVEFKVRQKGEDVNVEAMPGWWYGPFKIQRPENKP